MPPANSICELDEVFVPTDADLKVGKFGRNSNDCSAAQKPPIVKTSS